MFELRRGVEPGELVRLSLDRETGLVVVDLKAPLVERAEAMMGNPDQVFFPRLRQLAKLGTSLGDIPVDGADADPLASLSPVALVGL